MSIHTTTVRQFLLIGWRDGQPPAKCVCPISEGSEAEPRRPGASAAREAAEAGVSDADQRRRAGVSGHVTGIRTARFAGKGVPFQQWEPGARGGLTRHVHIALTVGSRLIARFCTSGGRTSSTVVAGAIAMIPLFPICDTVRPAVTIVSQG